MKNHYKLTIILALVIHFVNAQKYEWKKIENNFYQTTIFQKSKELLQNKDSLKLTVFAFDRNEIINLSDSTKQAFPKINLTFENLKDKLSVSSFAPALTRQSEFLVKYETQEKKVYEYEFFLLDSISQSQLNDFKKYLNETLEIINLKYISKKDAKLEASKLLGIESKDLFEGDIFPASVIIKTNKKVNLKNIEIKFKKILDDSIENNSDDVIHIFKIETE